MVNIDFAGKFAAPFNYVVANYEFRFNIVSAQYEFRMLKRGKPDKTKPWLPYDDRIRNNIMIEIFEKSMDLTKDKLDMLIESEIVSPDYDPFLEYFNNLKVWDQQTDHISEICKTITTPSEAHLHTTFKKFLVGTIDCLLNKDAVNDVCFVFQSSEQGVGKTRWMRKLLPEKFRDEYLYEGDINTRDKDHVQYLSQYWFIHLDELETLKGKDIGAIKSYITRQRISLRKAYGRYKSHFVRRASFLGSVNEDKFLTDITGNRRWLVFPTTRIDYQHMVDIDGLWSQAFFYYKQGFQYWFDLKDIREINKINEDFRAMSVEEEQLLQLFSFPTPEQGTGDWFSSTDVIFEISKNRPGIANKMVSQRMGRALSRHCNDKKKVVNGVSKYYLKSEGYDSNTENKSESYQPDSNSQIHTEDDDLPF